jgi:hypothetical protein
MLLNDRLLYETNMGLGVELGIWREWVQGVVMISSGRFRDKISDRLMRQQGQKDILGLRGVGVGQVEQVVEGGIDFVTKVSGISLTAQELELGLIERVQDSGLA